MISVFEFKVWFDIVLWLIWLVVVCGTARFLFGSFWFAELMRRIWPGQNFDQTVVQRLRWEISHGMKWEPGVANRDPRVKPSPLSSAELDERRRQFRELSHMSLWQRALTYFGGCWACQTFWAALAVYLVTRGVDSILSLLLTSVAYSGSAIVLDRLLPSRSSASEPGGCRGPGCR